MYPPCSKQSPCSHMSAILALIRKCVCMECVCVMSPCCCLNCLYFRFMSDCFTKQSNKRTALQWCPCDLPSDMEPPGQTVYFGVFGPAAAGEGLYVADSTTPETACSGPVGEERREGQSRRQDQPWPPRAPVRGPQQTPQHQPWCTVVSGCSSRHTVHLKCLFTSARSVNMPGRCSWGNAPSIANLSLCVQG